MSHLLTKPTVVLLAGGSATARERLQSVVADGGDRTVVALDSVEAVPSALAGRDDVGCLLLLDDVVPGDSEDDAPRDSEDVASAESGDAVSDPTVVTGCCDRVRDRDDALPILVVSDDASVATALAARRGCRYLPARASDAAVRTAVDEAVETYDARRRADAESSLFRTLLAEANVPMFAKDEAGRHLYKSGIDSDDVTPAEAVGKTDVDLVDEDYRAVAERTYRDDVTVIESGEPIREQEERAGSGDEEYWGLTTKVPWRDDDGSIQGLVGLSFDVTWWKQRERQLAAERQRIERFSKYLAHDLRTPLQVAYGALEPARSGDPAAFDRLETAHDRMRDIVDDLSGLSTGTNGPETGLTQAYDATRVGIATTHLAPLVEEVWNAVGSDGGTLAVEMPADAVVVCRSEILRSVLESLLQNAAEHAGPDVTVTVGTTADRAIFVADDGPGLPDEIAARLSDDGPLWSLDGFGSGLLVVADTVHQHGWELSIPADYDRGARLEIENCPVVTDTLVAATPGDSVPLTDDVDVGPVAHEGRATFDPGSDTWTVVANGENVWGDTNEFHLVYGTATAPVRIQGRIAIVDAVDEFTKAGFTVRAGLEPDAPFGYVGTTAEHGSETTWRAATDGHTGSDQFEERPDAFGWYRIEYGRGEVTCYLSADGEEWRPVDQRRVDLGERVVVGLSVCSHSADETCEVAFSNVEATELVVE